MFACFLQGFCLIVDRFSRFFRLPPGHLDCIWRKLDCIWRVLPDTIFFWVPNTIFSEGLGSARPSVCPAVHPSVRPSVRPPVRPSATEAQKIQEIHFLRFPTLCVANHSPRYSERHFSIFPMFRSANRSPIISESACFEISDVLF